MTSPMFTKQQADEIKVMVEAGDILGAEKLILKLLSSRCVLEDRAS